MVNFFLKHKDVSNLRQDAIYLDNHINDICYRQFIIDTDNGGFFFGKALQIYPNISENVYPGARFLNDKIQQEFGDLFLGYRSFGQDIFGNQFCIKTTTGEVVSFGIEDATVTIIAENFQQWLSVFHNDYNFYSGYSYYLEWLKDHSLTENQRIVPIKPFIIGGDYVISNFIASEFPRYIEYYSELAKHLNEIPDGTLVKIRYI